jgi:hypothetical protein
MYRLFLPSRNDGGLQCILGLPHIQPETRHSKYLRCTGYDSREQQRSTLPAWRRVSHIADYLVPRGDDPAISSESRKMPHEHS